MQRIEVVLVESTLATMVEAVIGGSLAEVALDGAHALLQQALDLRLIPADGLGVREVEDGILHGHAARSVHHVQPFLDDLREETVFGCEVRQLPQAGVEAVLRQLFQHTHRILEAVLRKLIVTLPVHTEPASIEVNDIRRNLVGPQLTGNLQALLLREISDTAHPRAEAPQGQHRTLARDVGILIQDILGFTEEHEEVHLLVGHKQTVCTNVRSAEVTGHWSRGVHEDAIAAVREEERHGLVLAVTLRTLRVCHGEVHLLSHLI